MPSVWWSGVLWPARLPRPTPRAQPPWLATPVLRLRARGRRAPRHLRDVRHGDDLTEQQLRNAFALSASTPIRRPDGGRAARPAHHRPRGHLSCIPCHVHPRTIDQGSRRGLARAAGIRRLAPKFMWAPRPRLARACHSGRGWRRALMIAPTSSTDSFRLLSSLRKGRNMASMRRCCSMDGR